MAALLRELAALVAVCVFVAGSAAILTGVADTGRAVEPVQVARAAP